MTNQDQRPAGEPQFVPKGADSEIIAQMRKEGMEIPGDETPEKKPEVTPEPEKKPEEKKEEPDPKPGEKKDGEDGEEHDPDRPIRTIPVWKHKDQLKDMERKHQEEIQGIRTEFQGKIDELSKKPLEERVDTSDDVKELADEFGIAPEAISRLADRIARNVRSSIKLPEDVSKKLEAFQERERQVTEEQGFEKEWENATDFIRKENKDLSDAEISAVKAKVKELAYTETYARYRLTDILRLESANLLPQKGRKTAEPGKGGSQAGDKVVDYSKITDDDLKNMSSAEFEKYSEFMAKQGSRYTRITRAPRIP